MARNRMAVLLEVIMSNIKKAEEKLINANYIGLTTVDYTVVYTLENCVHRGQIQEILDIKASEKEKEFIKDLVQKALSDNYNIK